MSASDSSNDMPKVTPNTEQTASISQPEKTPEQEKQSEQADQLVKMIIPLLISMLSSQNTHIYIYIFLLNIQGINNWFSYISNI